MIIFNLWTQIYLGQQKLSATKVKRPLAG